MKSPSRVLTVIAAGALAARVDPDAQLDAMIDQLTAAGPLEVYVGDDGEDAMRLKPESERLARRLAMTDEDGRDALLEALLKVVEA